MLERSLAKSTVPTAVEQIEEPLQTTRDAHDGDWDEQRRGPASVPARVRNAGAGHAVVRPRGLRGDVVTLVSAKRSQLATPRARRRWKAAVHRAGVVPPASMIRRAGWGCGRCRSKSTSRRVNARTLCRQTPRTYRRSFARRPLAQARHRVNGAMIRTPRNSRWYCCRSCATAWPLSPDAVRKAMTPCRVSPPARPMRRGMSSARDIDGVRAIGIALALAQRRRLAVGAARYQAKAMRNAPRRRCWPAAARRVHR